MKYRVLGRTGLRVGEIGVGCEGFLGKTPEQVSEWLDVLEEAGANCIDLYTPDPAFRVGLGRALRGRREKFVLQAHLCSRSEERRVGKVCLLPCRSRWSPDH